MQHRMECCTDGTDDRTECSSYTTIRIINVSSHLAIYWLYHITRGLKLKYFCAMQVLDAVRLLLSWLWDGPWSELTVDRVKEALLSVKVRDNEKLEDHIAEVSAVETTREEQAKKRQKPS